WMSGSCVEPIGREPVAERSPLGAREAPRVANDEPPLLEGDDAVLAQLLEHAAQMLGRDGEQLRQLTALQRQLNPTIARRRQDAGQLTEKVLEADARRSGGQLGHPLELSVQLLALHLVDVPGEPIVGLDPLRELDARHALDATACDGDGTDRTWQPN